MMPLVLLAGFLGAGKTHFLTRLLPRLAAAGVRPHVVLNDFRNARIDAARLAQLEALVTPLAGDCVCCGSLTELLDVLRAIPHDPRGAVLVEANGATETDELLAYLTMDRQLAHCTPPLQVTVVDAGRWQKRWWHNALEAAQLRTATHVVLNWGEKCGERRLAEVAAAVRTLAPQARTTTPERFADELAALAAALASPFALALYGAAGLAVGLHLLHGVESAHRGLGLLEPANGPAIRLAGRGLALLLGGGFALLPLALALRGAI